MVKPKFFVDKLVNEGLDFFAGVPDSLLKNVCAYITDNTQQHPENYVHVIFNNGAHDSVGGQPTVGLKIDLPAVAEAVGYHEVISVETKEELVKALSRIGVEKDPVFLQVCVKKGNRKDLGRPTTTPVQNKESLMTFLR